MELACQSLVLSKQVANFSSTNTNVTSRNVHVRTDNLIEFSHERLTESHDFSIALATWCKVGTTFTTTHRQCGQCILESLFKSEELQDAEVYRRVEAQSALVGTNG